MFQVNNRTLFISKLIVLPDEEGIDTAICVLKATFTLTSGKVKTSENQPPLVLADQYYGKPSESSLKYASEIGLPKPTTDIVALGCAYAPHEEAVASLPVSLRVGKYKKKLLVFGDRYWEKSKVLRTSSIGPPLTFRKIPLIYERAYGGKDTLQSDPEQTIAEERNPIGKGFRTEEYKNELNGLPLPNIEDPENLISKWGDRPAPAGFGYIAPHWKSRRQYVGTYNEKWQAERAPWLPLDFDSRFFNAAHPDLIADSYLSGGEKVELENMTPDGELSFTLPRLSFECGFYIENDYIYKKPHLDTLLIEPDKQSFSMIWRATEQCDKKALKIRQVEVNLLSSNLDEDA